MKNLFYHLLFLAFVGLPCSGLFSQPGYLFTDIGGSFSYYPLSDMGNFRQYTLTASGTHTDEWAFLVNNNFGSCAAPNCAVWRHYSSGGALIPFNTSIQPNGGANYGALYNDNTTPLLNGSASYMQTVTNGNRYTFNVVENGAADSWFSILETPYLPNNLTGSPTVNLGGTVTITGLPPTLNPGEYLYCRYSLNGFLTSGIVPVNVTGTTGTAQIPPQSIGATVTYYFYTSNKTSGVINADVSANGQQAHDLSTLKRLNNGGINYTFTFGGPVIILSSTGSNPSATPYANLKTAFDEINLATTHTGTIQVFINGNTTETASADLNITASYTSLTIIPAGGAARLISGTLNASLVRLNGADNVTIDGLNTGGNSLTFENTQSTGTGIATLTFLNDASGNTLQNCTVKGSTITATLGVIVINNGTGTTGNDNLLIQDNIITASGTNLPYNGIYAGATPGFVTINNNVSILDNHIYDYYNPNAECGGILCAGGNADWIISGNHFYQTSTRTATASTTTFTGIDIQNNTSDNFLISGNYIGGSAPFCAGIPLTLINGAGGPVLRAIKCNNAVVVGTSIQGNHISNFNITTTSTSNAQCGISLVTGKFFVGNITGNTISDISFSYNPTAATTGYFSGIFSGTGTGDNIVIQNNQIKKITVSSATNRIVDLRGINLQTGVYNVSNNKIGGGLPPEELLNTTTGIVSGLYSTLVNPNPQLIQGNTFQRLRSNAASGGLVYGMFLTSSGPTYSILNDTIKHLSSATGPINGISFSVNTSALHLIQENVIDSIISSNTGIAHVGVRVSTTGGSCNVRDNQISNISNVVGNVNGITFGSTTLAVTDTISGNIIWNLSGLNIYGVYVFNTGPAYQLLNNQISNFIGSTANGIYVTLSAGNSPVTIQNNQIDSLVCNAPVVAFHLIRGIELSGTGGNIQVLNNQVSRLFGTNGNLFGIMAELNAPSNSHVISGNTISQLFNNHGGPSVLSTVGINVIGNGNYTLLQNTISNLYSSAHASVLGATTSAIYVTAVGNGQIIDGNTIWNIANTNPFNMTGVMGIYYGSLSGGANSISRNNVHSISLSSANYLSQMYGIYINNGSVLVANNMVRLGLNKNGNSITGGYGITGIGDGGGTNSYYHNSVYIGGIGVTAGSPTFAFGSNSSGTRNIRNNIFMNARSHAVSSPMMKHYTIGINANLGLTLDYNAYYATGTDGYMGNYMSLPVLDLCSWKTTVGQDAFSFWGDPNYINPIGDSSTVNLHLNSPTPMEGQGTPGLVTIDIDNDTRISPPDLGADEGTFTPISPFTVNVSLGTFPAVCIGATSASLPYTIISGSPSIYSVSTTAPVAMPGFVPVVNAPLAASPIALNIPNATPAGTYNFIITFRNLTYCVSATYSFTVTVQAPALNITNPAPVCSPTTIDLTAPSVTTGSTLYGGSLSYWTDAGATISLANPNAVSATGVYYIKVTTAAGCTDIEPVSTTINPSPILVINNPAAVCTPTTIDLTAPSVIMGSTLNGGTLSYWMDAGATISLPNPSTVALTSTYYIKVSTVNGCTDIEPVSVVVNSVPVSTPITADVCTYTALSSTVTLTASGSGGTLEWYNNPLHSGSPLASGSTFITNTSGTYYVFINNGGCFSPGASAVATIRGAISMNIPVTPGNYWATHAVPQGSWTHYCNCPNDQLLVSVELNGQNIGTNLVNTPVSIGNGGNNYAVNMHIVSGNAINIPASVPYVDAVLNPDGWWVMPRTWDVYPYAQPLLPVNIRSYYKDVDFTNLNAEILLSGNIPVPSENDLLAYKLSGVSASVKLGDQHSGLTQNDIIIRGNNNPYLLPWTGGTNAPAFPAVHYFEYPVTAFSGGGGGGGANGNSPLPVTLLRFDGKNIGEENQLFWTTQNEINLSHFIVEKSSTQNNGFEETGKVEAKGEMQALTDYHFMDKTPIEGSNFYRLKMVDTDGHFAYSPITEVFFNSQLKYMLYPNPAKSHLHLSTSGASGNMVFSLYNAGGELVIEWRGDMKDNPLLSFSVLDLPQGAYFYQILIGDEQFSGKCMIE